MVKVSIIYESPIAYLARRWDATVENLFEMEQTFGWRALWEAGCADRCEHVLAQVREQYRKVIDRVPAAEQQVSLLRDLNAYEHFFTRALAAICAWPKMPSHEPDPKLAECLN